MQRWSSLSGSHRFIATSARGGTLAICTLNLHYLCVTMECIQYGTVQTPWTVSQVSPVTTLASKKMLIHRGPAWVTDHHAEDNCLQKVNLPCSGRLNTNYNAYFPRYTTWPIETIVVFSPMYGHCVDKSLRKRALLFHTKVKKEASKRWMTCHNTERCVTAEYVISSECFSTLQRLFMWTGFLWRIVPNKPHLLCVNGRYE